MNMDIEKEVYKILFDPTTGKIITLVMCFLVVLILNRIAKNLLSKKIDDNAMRYRTKKVVSFVSFILIIFSASLIFSDRLNSLTMVFGVAGAGIAFALQEVIASIAGWFAISFNHFYRVGDRVKLGGIKGDVIDIGILRTTLMEIGDWVNGDLYNGRTVRIFNSFVFKEPVFNYSAEYPFLWDEINIMIRHESDDLEAEKIIKDAAQKIVGHFEEVSKEKWQHMVKKFMIEDARVENFISVFIDGNGITFTLRYITDYKSRRSTKDQLYRNIHQGFKASNGKVEWAVSGLELSSRSAIELKVKAHQIETEQGI